MKWLSESDAYVCVYPDYIHAEDMTVWVDCVINKIRYAWAKKIKNYKRMRLFPLQETLREAEKAYLKTKNGLNS